MTTASGTGASPQERAVPVPASAAADEAVAVRRAAVPPVQPPVPVASAPGGGAEPRERAVPSVPVRHGSERSRQ